MKSVIDLIEYGKIWTFEIANFSKLQSGWHLCCVYLPLSLCGAILKQTSSLAPCHLADLAGCYCSQLQGLSSSCNHLWQSASVLSPSVPPTSFPSALRGSDLLALSFNPPAQCLASLRPLRPLQRWLKKQNNGDCSSAVCVPMQMEHEWMQILCFHRLCQRPEVGNGLDFQRPSAVQWKHWDDCVACLIYGVSLNQCIPFSLWCRWLRGSRARLGAEEQASLWSSAQPARAAAVQRSSDTAMLHPSMRRST